MKKEILINVSQPEECRIAIVEDGVLEELYVERAGQDVGAQHRNAVYEKKAEAAAGIGETDGEDHQTDERDADGRRPWEFPPKKQNSTDDPSKQQPQSRDTTGESGNLLDLSG